MSIVEAIVLGIIQGLTEFLPISSSGHMLLAGRVMDVNVSIAFELLMHLATLLAVIVILRKELLKLIKNPFKKQSILIVVASLPTVFIVFAFRNIFEKSFEGELLPYCFLITAIMLQATSIMQKRIKSTKEIGYSDAIIIGAMQGFAAFPGISRSGSTISVAVLLKNDKNSSAQFSFLLSIPIIIGSLLVTLLESFKNGENNVFNQVGVLPLCFGFVFSFVFGIIALKFMLKKLVKSFDFFAIYLLALSLLLLLNTFVLEWF